MTIDSSVGIAEYAEAITPDDSDLTRIASGLYVGTGGNLRVTTVHKQDVVFVGVPGGTFVPVRVKRVWNTNTTASDIVGLR